MNRLFSLDSPLMRFFSLLGDLILLNLLFLVFCLPVVTAGASACGLYAGVFALRRGDGGLTRTFWKGFCQCFGKATILWLLLGGILLFIGVDWYIMEQLLPNYRFLSRVVLTLPMILLALVAAYLFPLISRFENTATKHLRNALLLAVGHLPLTVALCLLNLAPVLLLLVSPYWFIRTSIVWLIIGFSGAAYVNARLLEALFNKLTGLA